MWSSLSITFPSSVWKVKENTTVPIIIISPNQSYFMHYKREHKVPENCSLQDKRDCAIKDTIMWKYYEQLNQNMKIALKNIFGIEKF
jgi:hypothetical protein